MFEQVRIVENMQRIEEIDKQIADNYEVLSPYVGKEVDADSDIGRLVDVTFKLMQVRAKLQNEFRKDMMTFLGLELK